METKNSKSTLVAKFAARPDSELSLPVRAERDLDCLECLTQRRCFWHAPEVPRGEVNDSEYGRLVTSLEGSFRG